MDEGDEGDATDEECATQPAKIAQALTVTSRAEILFIIVPSFISGGVIAAADYHVPRLERVGEASWRGRKSRSTVSTRRNEAAGVIQRSRSLRGGGSAPHDHSTV